MDVLNLWLTSRMGSGQPPLMDGGVKKFTAPFELILFDDEVPHNFLDIRLTSAKQNFTSSDACGLEGDYFTACTVYASLLAYHFCVAANQSSSPAQVMTRYTAADLTAWGAPTAGGEGELVAVAGFYLSSQPGDMGPGCEAYGLEWPGGLE
ncbi:hypothetical protein Daus18300_001440 [Diaporthe australafricana]|uniref:Uncharacterized protein n=1 Tax=Diaporthe australafricana TaxID=127596 RepID=A0ABR3XWZ5_9PEZI